MSRIVIIEDNPQNAHLASRILQRDGHEVLVAEDGELGLSIVLENLPDLVLVDLGLPDMDGQTVVAMLRQYDQFKFTPILAFTAWPEETAYDMAYAYGCDGVIIKPIDTRHFAEQVALYLEKV
jgi:two-component system, cell cycle response regulator DivK